MDIIELLKVIFLGIVEGITEWLPISSTGHMILVDEFIHLNVSQDFMDVFLVVIQLGAILAVVVFVFGISCGLFTKNKEASKKNPDGYCEEAQMGTGDPEFCGALLR